MSIRAEYKIFYGPDWREYRAVIIALRGPRCRICGADVVSYLNLSHETHDPRSSNVRLLCAGCHARADAPHRLAVWRRRKAERTGQMWLSPELEWAAFPVWMIPHEVFRRTQGRLFA
jgi:hypothetical protein